ncbi:stage II sporulation protein M [Paenibacillus sp. LMG 31456]|uniref:Stage II sporulation protein M n=1 Tax=Paenibacillus foliorum TaxID=2654974 RepID=A0A972JXW8_9BACL|nr:stage II sporulation protein M [Paenibacillus foliorum]NOU92919.1 stage II sporulation protein M [Paenibacillus foliorum]
MKNMLNQFRLMKHYFIASALVFTLGIILGAGFSDQFQGFIEGQLKGMEQLTQSLNGKPNQQWSLFWLIFWNNTIKSVAIIALGAVFGILPLFFLLANGLILGYLGSTFAQKESLLFFVKGILPHGVIEIPAIIFACAFGLRLGVLMLKMVTALISPERSVKYKEELAGFGKSIVFVVLILIVSLTAAALIESTFTYWLVKR